MTMNLARSIEEASAPARGRHGRWGHLRHGGKPVARETMQRSCSLGLLCCGTVLVYELALAWRKAQPTALGNCEAGLWAGTQLELISGARWRRL